MSLEELRRRADKFQTKIRNRNLREYSAAVFVLVAFGYYMWKLPPVRLGSALIIAATLYVMYQLHSRGAAKAVPESMALGSCLDFHRTELERQRDLARSIWKWYLLPLVPGLVAFLAVPIMNHPDQWTRALPFMLLCPAVFFGIWRLNQRGADRLQRLIDELNTLNKESL